MTHPQTPEWTDTRYTEMFHDFCIRTDFPNIDLTKLQEECDLVINSVESVTRSNFGGYQSPLNDSEKSMYTHFKQLSKLEKTVLDFASSECVLRNYTSYPLRRCAWWINKNDIHSYNAVHNHGRADLIGTFYVKSNPNAGDLVVLRNDGSCYTQLQQQRQFQCSPEEGKFYLMPGHLWHYVGENQHTDRISISFNLYIE